MKRSLYLMILLLMGWGYTANASEELAGVATGGVIPYQEQPITLLSEDLLMRIKNGAQEEAEVHIERDSFIENTSDAPYTLQLMIPEYAYGTGGRAQIRSISLKSNGQQQKLYYWGNPEETYRSPTALLPYSMGGYRATLEFLPKERKHLKLTYTHWGIVERGTEEALLTFTQNIGVQGWKGKPKRWKATILLEDTSLYAVEEISPRAWPWETDEERKRIEVLFEEETLPEEQQLTLRMGEGHLAFGRKYCMPGKVSSPNEGAFCTALDNDRGTSWNTPWTGSGVSLTVLHLPEGRWYEELTILPSGSYVEEGGKWEDHGRPKEVAIQLREHGIPLYSFASTLSDERVGNTIRFPQGVPVHLGSTVELYVEVKEIYSGEKFSDVGISEVQLSGLPLHMVEGREKEPSWLEKERRRSIPLLWIYHWRKWLEEIAMIWL